MFPDDSLVDQLMTFLAAGHETTTSPMTWVVYMLCLRPEVQDRLREKIRTRLPSFGDASKSLSTLDIDHMPYLNAVCSESLRYYPPAPLSVRVAAADTTIYDTRIPKGTRVVIVPGRSTDHTSCGARTRTSSTRIGGYTFMVTRAPRVTRRVNMLT